MKVQDDLISKKDAFVSSLKAFPQRSDRALRSFQMHQAATRVLYCLIYLIDIGPSTPKNK